MKGSDCDMEKECPECKENTLKPNDEWDKAYERLESNYPMHIFVVRELNRKRIPEYRCSNCHHEILAKEK